LALGGDAAPVVPHERRKPLPKRGATLEDLRHCGAFPEQPPTLLAAARLEDQAQEHAARRPPPRAV
jgi:hypothetical protein